jgi:hypothetical protein
MYGEVHTKLKAGYNHVCIIPVEKHIGQNKASFLSDRPLLNIQSLPYHIAWLITRIL